MNMSDHCSPLEDRRCRADRTSGRVPEHVRAAFERFDANRSGYLDYRELRDALRLKKELAGVDVSDVSAAAVLRRYDERPDGKLDLAEFARLVQDLEQGRSQRATEHERSGRDTGEREDEPRRQQSGKAGRREAARAAAERKAGEEAEAAAAAGRQRELDKRQREDAERKAAEEVDRRETAERKAEADNANFLEQVRKDREARRPQQAPPPVAQAVASPEENTAKEEAAKGQILQMLLTPPQSTPPHSKAWDEAESEERERREAEQTP